MDKKNVFSIFNKPKKVSSTSTDDTIENENIQTILQIPKTKFGNQNRAFSPVWYEYFDWLGYRIEKDAIFCYAYRNFSIYFVEDIFVQKGFKNWKKISGSTGSGSSKRSKSKLELHAACKHRLISREKWNSYFEQKKMVQCMPCYQLLIQEK
ncbi:hypothetical protein QTP88_000265 [Uroleucon formosanum]